MPVQQMLRSCHQPSEPGVVLSELFPKANDQKERHK